MKRVKATGSHVSYVATCLNCGWVKEGKQKEVHYEMRKHCLKHNHRVSYVRHKSAVYEACEALDRCVDFKLKRGRKI